MVTLFYILVFIALWHFFYESVLANSLRHGLRYEFFGIRDELRRLNIGKLNNKDQKIYELLDNSICHIINSMSFITYGNYLHLKKIISNDIKLKESIEDVKTMIESSENEKLKEINERIAILGGKALLINNGGWAMYLLAPFIIFLVIAIFFKQVDKLTNYVYKVSSRLIYSSENFVDSSNIDLA